MKPNLILWNSFYCTVVLESVVALIVLPCCSCCCGWCWCRCSCIWCCCGECIFSCKRFPRFLMLGKLNKRSTQFNTFLKFEMFRNFVRPLAFRFSFYHRCISTIHYSFEASPLWNDSLSSFSGLKKIGLQSRTPFWCSAFQSAHFLLLVSTVLSITLIWPTMER